MKRRELKRSLTIRLSVPLERRLGQRARERGETPSALVRSLLERELGEVDVETGPTLYELGRRSIGSVSSTRVPHGRDAEEALERWKPDSRG